MNKPTSLYQRKAEGSEDLMKHRMRQKRLRAIEVSIVKSRWLGPKKTFDVERREQCLGKRIAHVPSHLEVLSLA